MEDVATQRATPRRAVQAEMCAIAISPSFFFLLFLFFCSGEVWDVGQRRVALMAKVSYIFFPFCDAWVQIAGQVPTDLVEMICQF